MSQKQLLNIDADLIKKYGLTPDMELSSEDKKAFVLEQAEQVTKVVWRCRVELMALSMAEPKTKEQELGKEQEAQKLQAELLTYATALKSFKAIAEIL